jgi:membrane associated rhomboid family serine protease
LLGRWEATDLPAAKGLLALTLLVFAAQTLVALDGRVSLDRVLLQGGHVVEPFRFGAMPSGATDMLAEEPWRLLSACFVHFGIVHVFLNMLTFVHLARLAEPAVGSVRFFIVYVASGIISFATTVLWSVLAPQHGITAGASGSIFGLMGFVLGFLIRRRDPRWKLWLGQAVFISLLFSFAMTNVNNSAHIGGLCAGVAFGYAFAPGAPKPSTGWQRVTAAVGVLGCLGALLAAQLSPYWRLLARAVAAQAS